MTVYGYTEDELDQVFEELAKLDPQRDGMVVFSKGWAWPRTPLRERKILRSPGVIRPISASSEADG